MNIEQRTSNIERRIVTSRIGNPPLFKYPISNDQVCYLHLDIEHSLLDIGYSLFPLDFDQNRAPKSCENMMGFQ